MTTPSSSEKGPPRPGSKIWATLTTNLDYLPGILVLAHSLKRARSAFPLVVLYTDSFPAEGQLELDRRSIFRRRVPYLYPASNPSYADDPRFAHSWSKFSAFGLIEFERIVLLDGDMLVRRNMDELMHLPLDPPSSAGKGARVFAAGHACVCNPMQKSHYPSNWKPENCAFSTQHGHPDRAQRVGAGNEGSLGMLNGGLLVLNPCTEVFKMIRQSMDAAETAHYQFADQELLSKLFQKRWVSLPYVYNAIKTMRNAGEHEIIWRDAEVRNVHYTLAPKPWQEEVKGRDDLNVWWHTTNEERIAEEQETLPIHDV